MGWMGLLWILALVVCVYVVVRFLGPTIKGRTGPESPEDVQRTRYARGVIDGDEYERKRGDLRRWRLGRSGAGERRRLPHRDVLGGKGRQDHVLDISPAGSLREHLMSPIIAGAAMSFRSASDTGNASRLRQARV
jgi:hypothetical protein